MGMNKTVAVIKKQTTVKTISKVIAGILLIFILSQAFMLIAAGARYVQNFGTGTVSIGLVDIAFSSLSEKIQVIFLCTLSLVVAALAILGNVLLWGFFNQIASNDKPFLPDQGKQLQKIAVLTMLQALLLACCNPWAIALSNPTVHISWLITTFVFSLGQGMIYPLIFFCMALIFNYAMGLQTESDETL